MSESICPTCGSAEFTATTITESEYREALYQGRSGWVRRGENEEVLGTRLTDLVCSNGHPASGALYSALSAAWDSAQYVEEAEA